MHTHIQITNTNAGALPDIVFTGCEGLAAAPAQWVNQTNSPN